MQCFELTRADSNAVRPKAQCVFPTSRIHRDQRVGGLQEGPSPLVNFYQQSRADKLYRERAVVGVRLSQRRPNASARSDEPLVRAFAISSSIVSKTSRRDHCCGWHAY